MSELNPEIQKILNAHGIDPAPEPTTKEVFDAKFGDPMAQLDDLFETFGRIFAPYEKANNIKPKGWRKDQEDNRNI